LQRPSSVEVKECLALYLHPNTSSWRGVLLSSRTTLPLHWPCFCSKWTYVRTRNVKT